MTDHQIAEMAAMMHARILALGCPVISVETLNRIVATYEKMYKPPQKAGTPVPQTAAERAARQAEQRAKDNVRVLASYRLGPKK